MRSPRSVASSLLRLAAAIRSGEVQTTHAARVSVRAILSAVPDAEEEESFEVITTQDSWVHLGWGQDSMAFPKAEVEGAPEPVAGGRAFVDFLAEKHPDRAAALSYFQDSDVKFVPGVSWGFRWPDDPNWNQFGFDTEEEARAEAAHSR